MNRSRTGMVVKDRCRPVFDTIYQCDQGAVVNVFLGQYLVQPPPQALQDLLKIDRRRIFQCHAPGKGAIEMRMGIDQSGHDNPAPDVHHVGSGVFPFYFPRRTDFYDEMILDGDTSVGNVGLRFISGKNPAVSNQQQVSSPCNSKNEKTLFEEK